MKDFFKKFKKLFKGAKSGIDASSGTRAPEGSSPTSNKGKKVREVRMPFDAVEVSTVPQPIVTSNPPFREEVMALPGPVEVATRPRLRESTASQLFEEFVNHVTTELSDSACRDMLKEYIHQSCSTANQSVVREALQAVANSFANCICDHFEEKIKQKVAAAQDAPWRAQLPDRPLQEADDYANFLSEFVQQNLGRFYKPHDKDVENIATQAAQKVSLELNVPNELMPGLAKLALYDFIILCDDSGSMHFEDRFIALEDTLGRVATFATILSPDGISIRTLNYSGDEQGWDNLKTVGDIKRRMEEVMYNGGTPLGTKLSSKILEPMILSKAKDGSLKKPVIIVIITDGEESANHEGPQKLRDSIRDCNTQMQRQGYDDASVIYLISRVGTSKEAQRFVQELGNDPSIGSTVFVSPSDLAAKRAVLEKSGDNNAYTVLLIQLFLSALQVRTTAGKGPA